MYYEEVPKYVLRYTTNIIYGVVVPILVVIGLFGNILTFLVLKKELPMTSTTRLLFALTCADFVYMLTTAFSDALIIAKFFIPDTIRQIQIRFFLPMETVGWSMPSYISNWMVVMISLERAIAVTFPLKAKQIWTKRASSAAICVAIFLPTISAGARLLKARGVPARNNITNVTTYRMELFYVPGLDRDFYDVLRLVNTYMLYVVPLCIVICANICIVVGIYRNKGNNMTAQNVSMRRKRDNRISRMLLSLCAMFCLCVLPYTTLTTYNISTKSSNNNQYIYKNSTVELLIYVAYACLICNSAMNFVIYVATSSTFRRRYIDILCSSCTRYKENQQNLNANTDITYTSEKNGKGK
ncbi:hypothetical protein FSP39_005487 [Pinctada imbricata]|uniref:G-protein coupled receptors family 1 profile domain-containing protein n=1 Tax=Pinctada imbricata TaxID=66713 RepID=A0AA88YD16_PINIB|nr:hypothetical protein FSP39_005487 [Pinctada imbricata]